MHAHPFQKREGKNLKEEWEEKEIEMK